MTPAEWHTQHIQQLKRSSQSPPGCIQNPRAAANPPTPRTHRVARWIPDATEDRRRNNEAGFEHLQAAAGVGGSVIVSAIYACACHMRCPSAMFSCASRGWSCIPFQKRSRGGQDEVSDGLPPSQATAFLTSFSFSRLDLLSVRTADRNPRTQTSSPVVCLGNASVWPVIPDPHPWEACASLCQRRERWPVVLARARRSFTHSCPQLWRS
ncbi:hypothetical protein OH76DRAFT_965115 [Lentinus brumalis]|uniref:Uncharacterized protein n=1 Tax=Lentinus brumalis TaxID=2498619 RepID=A0A371DPK2_9APHY|nr:hypothetical protein OH76DRAFT_965115 [Polyporus brumalis]